MSLTSGCLAAFFENQESTGEIQLPLLTLQTTADLFVPLSGQLLLQQAADASGTSNLLVQRTVQAAGHCGMLNEEWRRAFEDLVAWVEDGIQPGGEDLLGDISDAGSAFTLAPRIGSSRQDCISR